MPLDVEHVFSDQVAGHAAHKSLRWTWPVRCAAFLLMTIVVAIVVEGVSLGTLVIQAGSWQRHRDRRERAANQANEGWRDAEQVASTMLHPYVGSVPAPTTTTADLGTDGSPARSTFVNQGLPIHRRSADRLLIGITGGSAARRLSKDATDVLATELLSWPEFAGRTCHFALLAADEYKQPQQLMLFNYQLSQGAEFDLLINLDGLNEVTAPVTGNIPAGLNTCYPSDWGQTTVEVTRTDYLHNIGLVKYLNQQQRVNAIRAGTFPSSLSPTAQLIWSYEHSQRDRDIAEARQKAEAMTRQAATYCSSGPPEEFRSPQEMYDRCIDLWCRSSILLHRECEINNIRYYHFLEPIPRRTPAAQDARGVAISSCIPLMQTSSLQRLKDAAVEFTDLSDLGLAARETNVTEEVILIKAIAASIKQALVRIPGEGSK